MTAATATATPSPSSSLSGPQREWATIADAAPQLASTAERYLEQIGLSLRASSVVVANAALRLFCRYLVEAHPDTNCFAAVRRAEIEGFKRAVAQQRTAAGKPLSTNTRRSRLGLLCTFFDRIIEWDWVDAPPRTPIFTTDLPKPDEPLPRFGCVKPEWPHRAHLSWPHLRSRRYSERGLAGPAGEVESASPLPGPPNDPGGVPHPLRGRNDRARRAGGH
jgi:hypothetical protein